MKELTVIFQALSEETRLKILKLLQHGELCVCDIVAALDMTQPKVSFHLNTLKKAALIKDRKRGKWILYRISDADLFRRFLVMSALERINDSDIADYKRRLDHFLKGKYSRQAKIGAMDCVCKTPKADKEKKQR